MTNVTLHIERLKWASNCLIEQQYKLNRLFSTLCSEIEIKNYPN